MLFLKRLLLFVVVALSPATLPCAGKNTPSPFFDGPVKFFEEVHTDSGCKGCPGEADDSSAAIAGLTARQQNSKPAIKPTAMLYVFVVPGGQYSLPAVQAAKSFGVRHPEVSVRGVLLVPISGLKKSLQKNPQLFDKTFPFDFDPLFDLAKKYGISESPSFVFVKGTNAWKVSGQPDLDGVIRLIHLTALKKLWHNFYSQVPL